MPIDVLEEWAQTYQQVNTLAEMILQYDRTLAFFMQSKETLSMIGPLALLVSVN